MTIPLAALPLRRGSEGLPVIELQRLLGITADGKFGPATEGAVRAYQAGKGLVSDGVVGPTTAAALQGAVPPPAAGGGGVTLSAAAIAKLFPNAAPQIREAIFAAQRDAFPRFGINATPRRLAYFLAQSAEESGGYSTFGENLNYTVGRAKQVWPQRASKFADLVKPGQERIEVDKRKLDPEKLANEVYGSRMGNNADGDGWRYRGRGPIQLTGKANYREIGDLVGLDLVNKPDLAQDPAHMMTVFCGYWAKHNLNRFADSGRFQALGNLINAGAEDREAINSNERKRWLAKIESELA